MLRKSLIGEVLFITIKPLDRKKCNWIANFVLLQCLVICVGSFTILDCIWSPDNTKSDFDKLVRIMYLYDYQDCGYKLMKSATLSNIQLSNDTYGLDVKPIKWAQATLTVSTRLSSKTRKYIDSSLVVNVIWMVLAIALRFVLWKSQNPRLVKTSISTFFFYSICIVIFDMSMAFVYIGHIQQSVTKGMVLRHSGWSVELQLKNYDDFAGWIPIAASILWMRGIVIMIWNIICCRYLNSLRRRIKAREVRVMLTGNVYEPIPDPKLDKPTDSSVLYYRQGEFTPAVHENLISRVFKFN